MSQNTESLKTRLDEQLETITQISGSSLGYSGNQLGEFLRFSMILINFGKHDRISKDEMISYLSHANPIFKAMGIYCIPHLNYVAKNETINLIKSNLSDKSEISYWPSGCVVRSLRLGEFAREVLKNPRCLGTPFNIGKYGPFKTSALLNQYEQLALDFELLGDDNYEYMHYRCSRSLKYELNKGAFSSDLAELQKMFPNLGKSKINKALNIILALDQ